MAPKEIPSPRTIGEFIAAGTMYLARHSVDAPRVACELLACRLFRCPRLELFLHHDEAPTQRLVDAWRRGLKRVADGEPLQYVLGEWDFRRLTLCVDRRALIPRPETEQLVDLVLQAPGLWATVDAADGRVSPRSAVAATAGQTDHVSSDPPQQMERRIPDSGTSGIWNLESSIRNPFPENHALPLILDVGTGSGCIVLSLATERPQARYIAIDASAEALELARVNAARCGAAERIEFRLASGCGEFPAGSVAAIVANLPYIPTAEVARLERHIREHEPAQALDGGPDGLDIVRAVAHDAAMVLRPGGWLFLEIGDAQGPATRELLAGLGFAEVAILPDLAGKTRFAQAKQG